MPSKPPCSRAFTNPTLVFAEELKIQRKPNIAKGIITVQLLDRAENTPTMKLIHNQVVLLLHEVCDTR